MTLGKRIRQLRTSSGLTQRALGEATGLAVSYLSRLENERIAPTVRTLGKIGEALSVPMSALFESEPVLESSDRCPVSLAGRCILDELHVGRGPVPRRSGETYSARQLEMLRLCNIVLHSKDSRLPQTLGIFLESLVALAEDRVKRSARKRPQDS